MKLYLNDKERSLDFLRLIEVMLEGGINSATLELPTINTIYQSSGISDPVREFIEYYIADAGIEDEFDQARIDWIINALYSVKGAPQIFEVFQQSMGIPITYEYKFPVVEVLSFGELLVTDVTIFADKFKAMIYHLLYYTDMNLVIENLILNISSLLTQYSSIATKGFINYELILSDTKI